MLSSCCLHTSLWNIQLRFWRININCLPYCLVQAPWRGTEGSICKESHTADLEVLPMVEEVDEHVGGAVQGGQEVRGLGCTL